MSTTVADENALTARNRSVEVDGETRIRRSSLAWQRPLSRRWSLTGTMSQ